MTIYNEFGRCPWVGARLRDLFFLIFSLFYLAKNSSVQRPLPAARRREKCAMHWPYGGRWVAVQDEEGEKEGRESPGEWWNWERWLLDDKTISSLRTGKCSETHSATSSVPRKKMCVIHILSITLSIQYSFIFENKQFLFWDEVLKIQKHVYRDTTVLETLFYGCFRSMSQPSVYCQIYSLVWSCITQESRIYFLQDILEILKRSLQNF